MKTIQIKKNNDKCIIPEYITDGASGADVYACIEKSVFIGPGERVIIPTGFSASIPDGCEIQVRPRSGLAIKYGISVINSPGTIDSDFTGEIGVILINHSKDEFVVTPGLRIAQIVCTPVYKMKFDVVDEIKKTKRASGGFGSTGE